MRKTKCWMRYISCLLVLLPNLAWTQQSYVAETLGRLEYGSQDTQVGVFWGEEGAPPESVRGMAVDDQGNIYLGDLVNGKIKKFGKNGELLAVTEGKVYSFTSFAVDSNGNIYLHQGSQLTKFAEDGRLLWRRLFSEIVSTSELIAVEKDLDIEILPMFGGWISTGPLDEPIVELNGWDPRKDPGQRGMSLGLQIDQDGKLVQILPDFRRGGAGLWWSYEASMVDDQPPPFVSVKVYSDTGVLSNTIQLQTTADNGIHFAGVRTGVSTVLPDKRGGIFVLTYAAALQPVYLAPRVSISSDMVLNRFDSNGAFLEEWRIPGTPFGGVAGNLGIAPDGSLYHLRFDQSGVDIIAYRRVAQTTAKGPGVHLAGLKGRRVHELVSYRSGNITFVPLAVLAQRLGYKITWNSKSGTAQLAKTGSRILFRTNRNVMVANGRENRLRGKITMKEGRVWVPATEVASLLSLPLKVDKQQRVAFLVLP